ncbi:glycosyltransferase family 4 protein [Cyclobacterium xiamenense]|uniref:glycosyltransferase family 4 protein n=1 Tax=Cyclobacterium xiamenense TaxID=1297121 RepID=UPI0035CFD409
MPHKILIVNQNSGYLTIDVANAFITEYDEVVLMYGLNQVTERTLHPKVKVQKTITYNRASKVKRLWTWGICTIHLTCLLAWKYRGYRVLYYTNPPMSYFNALLFSNPFSVVVFDAYPDSLKVLGIRESSLVFRTWKWLNRKLFSKATQIITLSEGMKQQLCQYVVDEKIKVVSIWAGSESFGPIPKKENPFLKEHNWEDKFVVLYSGNMGIGHKLEVLIEVADSLRDRREFLFLFVGEGAKKNVLRTLACSKGLINVVFLTWQGAAVLPYSLAAADIAVVALEPEAARASVPSKTFNYMAVGAPILAIGSQDSELASMITNYQVGFNSPGVDAGEIQEFILSIFANKEKSRELSGNSLKAVQKHSCSNSIQYIFH